MKTKNANECRLPAGRLSGVAPAMMLASALLAVLALLPARSETAAGAGSKGADPASARQEMIYLPGGTFEMGYAAGHADEKPVHAVTLRPFLIDPFETTNRQFSAFVEATGYVTQAEQTGYAWCYLKDSQDFQAVQGADWRHPQGPGSSIAERMDHPVVNVSWNDAAAYAKWAGKRLPSEAEWEFAARSGGLDQVRAAGGESHSAGAHSGKAPSASPSAAKSGAGSDAGRPHHGAGEKAVRANIWNGTWPLKNELRDGFYYTAPAGSFSPNQLGIYDMIGNVWEWTADWYDADYYSRSPSQDPAGPDAGVHRVARGGSWFCSPNYCGAYSSHFRGSSPPDSAFNNVGFRCAADAEDSAKGEAQ